jgi:hypothetical protein
MELMETRKLQYVFGLLGSMIIAVIVFSYWSFGSTPAFAQVVATSILVLASMISAAAAWSNVRVSRKSREQEFKPLIMLDVRGYALDKDPVLVLENQGNGPAENIELKLELSPSGRESSTVSRKILPEDDFTAVQGLFGDEFSFDSENEDEVIRVTGQCEDIFGNVLEIDREFDLDSFSGRNMAEAILRHNDEKSDLANIDRRLRGINENIGSISAVIQMFFEEKFQEKDEE